MAHMMILKEWLLRQNPAGPLLIGCIVLATGSLLEGVLPEGVVYVMSITGLALALWGVVAVIDKTP